MFLGDYSELIDKPDRNVYRSVYVRFRYIILPVFADFVLFSNW